MGEISLNVNELSQLIVGTDLINFRFHRLIYMRKTPPFSPQRPFELSRKLAVQLLFVYIVLLILLDSSIETVPKIPML